jgi:hypothetical protein
MFGIRRFEENPRRWERETILHILPGVKRVFPDFNGSSAMVGERIKSSFHDSKISET